MWPVPTPYRNPRVQRYPNACEQNVVLWRAGSNAGRVILRTTARKREQKSVFGNSVFPGATIFEGYTQAESRNAVSPSRFFVEKNHGSQPPATADSIIFTSFRCSGKKHEFQNVVRNLNFKILGMVLYRLPYGGPGYGGGFGVYLRQIPAKNTKQAKYLR